jgi:K+-dependent Na+/Ca+ exchanger-like protein
MVAFSLLENIFGECHCQGTFECQSPVDANGGIVIWIVLTLWMFKCLGTVCDEYFVPALEMISEKLNLSSDVAGATFMAAGSSAPELFTSVVATFLIVNEGGVGAIIGSAIFNILVIVGATCAFAGQVLVIQWYPLARDCSFYMLSILELGLFIRDETVQWWEALIMFLSYCMYCVYMKYNEKVVEWMESRNEEKSRSKVYAEEDLEVSPGANKAWGTEEAVKNGDIPGLRPVSPTTQSTSVPSSLADTPPEEGDSGGGEPIHRLKEFLPEENQKKAPAQDKQKEASPGESERRGSTEQDNPQEVTEQASNSTKRRLSDPIVVIWEKTMPSPERYWSLFFMSILNIALCTYVMVDAVNRAGCNLNVSPLIMGLIFLAAGTSIPDALGSIAVAKQGEGDMAVANALGSNVFDILLGLGVPWLITAFMGRNVTFKNVSADLLYWICVLVGIVVLFIAALILNKWTLNKTMGVILMTLYLLHVSAALYRALV